jgi:hypothetical protein
MKRIERFYEKWQIDNLKDFYSVEEMFSFAESYLEFVNKEKTKDESKMAGFEEFWDAYHKLTGKPKTDNESGRREWSRLTPEEKQKARANIISFFNTFRDKSYCNKAYTYLKNKLFNNEFVTATTPFESTEPKIVIKTGIKFEDIK